MLNSVEHEKSFITSGPDNHNLVCQSGIVFYFQFKQMLWVLKRNSSFEYPQHMFWLRNTKKSALLSEGLNS